MEYYFLWSVLIKNWPAIWRATTVTLWVCLLSILLSTLLGIVLAPSSMSNITWLKRVIRGYIEVVRNTPLLVQLYFIYFGIYEIGIQMSPFPAVVIALVLNNGGYISEILRGGLESIPKTQKEASLSLGLSSFRTFYHIYLPQALKKILPALGNQYLALTLSSSLGAAIALEELTFSISRFSSMTFRAFEFYLAGTFLYIAITFSVILLMRILGYIFFSRRRKFSLTLRPWKSDSAVPI